jgi:hypothetical protein
VAYVEGGVGCAIVKADAGEGAAVSGPGIFDPSQGLVSGKI